MTADIPSPLGQDLRLYSCQLGPVSPLPLGGILNRSRRLELGVGQATFAAPPRRNILLLHIGYHMLAFIRSNSLRHPGSTNRRVSYSGGGKRSEWSTEHRLRLLAGSSTRAHRTPCGLGPQNIFNALCCIGTITFTAARPEHPFRLPFSCFQCRIATAHRYMGRTDAMEHCLNCNTFVVTVDRVDGTIGLIFDRETGFPADSSFCTFSRPFFRGSCTKPYSGFAHSNHTYA
ncbi:hypothetical protein V8E53_005445 [Lactarius tabidus]